MTLLAADTHVHLHPDVEPARTVVALARNLARLAAEAGAGPEGAPLAGFLTERHGARMFEDLRDGQFMPAGIAATPAPDPAVLVLSGPALAARLYLVAGRQAATRERIEILGLGMTAPLADGLAAEAAIEAVRAAGGIPVLAWSPGKWWFARGRLVRDLLARCGRGLAVGDTALRPAGWPEPALLRRARANGAAVLPGSDPLPLPGEDRLPGTYGLTCPAMPGDSSPLAALRRAVTAPDTIHPAGRRRGPLDVFIALARLRAAAP